MSCEQIGAYPREACQIAPSLEEVRQRQVFDQDETSVCEGSRSSGVRTIAQAAIPSPNSTTMHASII
jgi:hypothetical protein